MRMAKMKPKPMDLETTVLLTLVAVFGGEALWYTPIISEALCLAMSALSLRRYRRESAA